MITAISESHLWKKRLGDWVINPYIGCEHGCAHCFCPGMPGVKFHNESHSPTDWGKYLIPRTGIVEALERQLVRFTPAKARRTAWGDAWILMSFLTDCYTPAEGKHRLTRQCVQRLLEAGHKLRLQTRSAMVERDFDILRAHPGQVLLGTSLPHLDDALARCLEPRATGPTRRLRMLERAAGIGIPIYLCIAPVYPFHDTSIVEEVGQQTAHLPLREIFCEVLNPKGANMERMLSVLASDYPQFAKQIAAYPGEPWAEFTWKVLESGHRNIRRFVPWPDTRGSWRKFLSAPQSAFLDRFLPPKEESTPEAVTDIHSQAHTT